MTGNAAGQTPVGQGGGPSPAPAPAEQGGGPSPAPAPAEQGGGPSPAPVVTTTDSEMTAVQSAARWLVAAAAAVTAVLLTGVQFSALGRLTTEASIARLGVALVASAMGLLAVGALLVLAARVLIHPGWTLSRMAHLESFEPGQWVKHWMREQLSARRGLLVSSQELDPSALYRRTRNLMIAWTELLERGETEVATGARAESSRVYKLSSDRDVWALQARLEAATAESMRITSMANLLATRRRYQMLVRSLPGIGLVLIAAVVVFAAATDVAPPVTTPTAVRVHFNPDATQLLAAAMPPTCAGKTIDGVAVGGSWEEPVVVAISPGCVLSDVQITDAAGIVVPSPPTK